jgi:hypothetical protein
MSVPVRVPVGVACQDGVMRVSAGAGAVLMMSARVRGGVRAGSLGRVIRDRGAAELVLHNEERGGQLPGRRRERGSVP